MNAPAENKIENRRTVFHEELEQELEQELNQIRKYRMKLMLRDCNGKLGGEDN
jgi:phage-related protein